MLDTQRLTTLNGVHAFLNGNQPVVFERMDRVRMPYARNMGV